ncbi:lipolysis-activating peptide 1-alpha chain-like [Centruroides sculpturatus]|uniref:lipolysis-activating peptide 1-alpha chain-like n=1 Tax=Centruroides sculpturatus TaxID=218467 RepID=UPI000C6C8A44|nr:lipolysis-activating peptide 1-alpha chain-like [Centruroides sculpturatus]XP_023230241.1 lipolysis-activating peptide 1-alpha chain-like [Centruroides sculpturatus]XP_023230248.1 lipolysis-activating peptide 1-alpha chain-like [Centruroides sculpturatus]
MKIYMLFAIIFVLCLFEIEEICGKKEGGYPRYFSFGYKCQRWGVNEYCQDVCKLHKGGYGYCYGGECYCEGLTDETKYFWDVYRKYCKNSLVN